MRHHHAVSSGPPFISVRIEENIGQLQRRGLYRKDVDAKVASWAIAGAYNNLVRRMIGLKTKPDFTAWVDSMTKFCTSGLENR